MYSMFDAHCDTITELFKNKEELFSNRRHVSIARLLSFAAPVQVFAVWLNKTQKRKFYDDTMEVIDFYFMQLKKYGDYITHANSYQEIQKNQDANMISAVLAIEGGEALEGNIDNLKNFYDKGVRILTLTWNNKNELGDGVGVEESGGLTDFGFEIVEKMNEMGMIIDVSHLSEKGFWDVAERSSKAVIASHSNAYEVCSHKRNLKDEQILKIAESGGVVGMNLYPPHVSENKTAKIMDVIKHIDHIVKLAGADCVGLGCDFDGIEKTPEGIYGVDGVNRLANILELIYGSEITEKIMHGNFERLFRSVCDIVSN